MAKRLRLTQGCFISKVKHKQAELFNSVNQSVNQTQNPSKAISFVACVVLKEI